MLRTFLLALVTASFLGMYGCDSNEGPAEKAGEAMDDAADSVKDAVDDAGDSLSEAAQDACDEVGDATDSDVDC